MMKKTIAFFIVSIIILNSCICQVITDNAPLSYYYSKIEFTKFPEPEIGKQGMIFFTSETTFLDNFVKTKVDNTIKENKEKLYLYKFRKNKFRYTDYFYTVDNIQYISSGNFKLVSDTTTVSILATRNKRKWSWRDFKLFLEKVSVDTIYSGKVYSNLYFDISNSLKIRELVFKDLTMSLSKNGIQVFNKVISTSDWTISQTRLTYNFHDAIVKENSILESLDLNNLYIKPGKELSNILLYCPVLYR